MGQQLLHPQITLRQLIMDYTCSSGHSHRELMSPLLRQLEFPENSVIVVTDCSYNLNSGELMNNDSTEY